jgi:hypothetical protein
MEKTLDEKPPIMGEWKNLYTLVLLFHAALIAVFYLLTIYFS